MRKNLLELHPRGPEKYSISRILLFDFSGKTSKKLISGSRKVCKRFGIHWENKQNPDFCRSQGVILKIFIEFLIKDLRDTMRFKKTFYLSALRILEQLYWIIELKDK